MVRHLRTLRLLTLVGPPSEWMDMPATELDWLLSIDAEIKTWHNEQASEPAASSSPTGGREVSVEAYEALTRQREG